MEKNWAKYHDNKKFAPSKDGLYEVFVDTPRSRSPYKRLGLTAVEQYDIENILYESADVANFAMFVADRCQQLKEGIK